MIKRTLSAILTAVFLFGLCIPCGAAGARREYPGFSDVAEGSASYEAIKLCYERGLMNGVSETSFAPQGQLTVAQLVVLAARLYDLQNGGEGTVPDLPDLSQPYVRYRDENGTVFASCTIEEALPSLGGGYVALTGEENADLPEACTLEVGYEGYNHIRTYAGVRETYHSEPGYMTQGFYGTGYRFESTDEPIYFIAPEYIGELKKAWWFPAAFYLGSEGVMGFEGELLYYASGGDQYDGYDPLTRISSDNASRSLFAWLVDRTAGELEVINPNAKLPADVNPEWSLENADAVLRLYQAGILTGVDKAGNFHGSGALTRGQAAMMLDRVLDPASRVKTG